ncbi:RodZ domain-containing protein [Pseudanabaena sp. PCC 6802]|uniref:RodZ domain-containing protein n=1 Tax=Pseudanabaena sp. PCC 6802 TaxID=118173 RepID=UPI00037238E8|nr:RodZ domain-containing protein [Pseudanabaena sp. PCC 6802]
MNTNSNQSSKLAEIGAQLKQMRESKRMSISQVTAKTLIAERHLRAIEEGNLDSLPEPIYVQGFIRKYGKALGLEGLAEDFPVTSEPSPQNWSSSPAAELRPLHLYALYILIIAGAVSLLASLLNPLSNNRVNEGQTNLSPSARVATNAGQGNQAKPKPTQGPTVATKPAPKPTPAQPNAQSNVKPKPNAPTNAQASNDSNWADFSNLVNASSNVNPAFNFSGDKPVNVGIAMTNQSWLRVTVDDKIDFEGILSEGTRKSWSANQSIVVRAGNAAAVSVTFNQTPSKVLGAEGEVVEQTFDKNKQTNTSESSDSNNTTPTTSPSDNTPTAPRSPQ